MKLHVVTSLLLLTATAVWAQDYTDYQDLSDDELQALVAEYLDMDSSNEQGEKMSESTGAAGVDVSVWPAEFDAAARAEVGQIGGVAVDVEGRLHVFHRGSRSWEFDSFDESEVFAKRDEGAIKEHTYMVRTLFIFDGRMTGSRPSRLSIHTLVRSSTVALPTVITCRTG